MPTAVALDPLSPPQPVDFTGFLRCPLCHALLRCYAGEVAEGLTAAHRAPTSKVQLPSEELLQKLLHLEADVSREEDRALAGHLCHFHSFHRHRYVLWLRLGGVARDLLPKRRELFVSLAAEMERAEECLEPQCRSFVQAVSRHVRTLQQDLRQSFRRSLLEEARQVANQWQNQLGEVEQQIGQRIGEREFEISESLDTLERLLEEEIESKQARRSRYLVQEYAEEIRHLEEHPAHIGAGLVAVLESVQLKQAERMRFGAELRQALLARVQQAKFREQRDVAIWANKLANLRDLQEWQMNTEQELVMSRVDIAVKRLEKEQALDARRIMQLFGQHMTHLRNLLSRRERSHWEMLMAIEAAEQPTQQLPAWPWAMHVMQKELGYEGALPALCAYQPPKALANAPTVEMLDAVTDDNADRLQNMLQLQAGLPQAPSGFAQSVYIQERLVSHVLSTNLRRAQPEECPEPSPHSADGNPTAEAIAKCAELVSSFLGCQSRSPIVKPCCVQDLQALMSTSASTPARSGFSDVAAQEAFVDLSSMPRHVKVKHNLYGSAEQRRSFMCFRSTGTSTPAAAAPAGARSRSVSRRSLVRRESSGSRGKDTLSATDRPAPLTGSMGSSAANLWRSERGAPPPRAAGATPGKLSRMKSDSSSGPRPRSTSAGRTPSKGTGAESKSRSSTFRDGVNKDSPSSRAASSTSPCKREASTSSGAGVSHVPPLWRSSSSPSRSCSQGQRDPRGEGPVPDGQVEIRTAPIQLLPGRGLHQERPVSPCRELEGLSPQVMRQASQARLHGLPPSPVNSLQLRVPPVATADVIVSGKVEPRRSSPATVSQIGACFSAPATGSAHVQVSVTPVYPALSTAANVAQSYPCATQQVRSRTPVGSAVVGEMRSAGCVSQLPQPQAPPRRATTPSRAAMLQQAGPQVTPMGGIPTWSGALGTTLAGPAPLGATTSSLLSGICTTPPPTTVLTPGVVSPIPTVAISPVNATVCSSTVGGNHA